MNYVAAIVCSLILALYAREVVADSQGFSSIVRDESEFPDVDVSNNVLLNSLISNYGGFFSSLMWMNIIFSYADQIILSKPDPAYGQKLRIVVNADTLWEYPYEFAGLTIEGKGGAAQPIALEILSKGVLRFPGNARMAIILSQEVLKATWIDSAKRLDSARKILLPLMSSKIHAPEFARTLSITMTANIYGDRQALRQLFYVWSSEKDPLVQYSFSKKLPVLLAGATRFEHDSLKVVERGINIAMQSHEAGVGEKMDSLIDDLNDPKRRGLAYRLLLRIQES